MEKKGYATPEEYFNDMPREVAARIASHKRRQALVVGAVAGLITGFALAPLGAAIGTAIGGGVGSFTGAVAVGALSGAVTGGVSAVAAGGNFWQGARAGAVSGAVAGALRYGGRRVVDWLIGENGGSAWIKMFTERWTRGPTGGWLPQSIAKSMRAIAKILPSNSAANGMHSWHAGSNALLAKKFGILGAPFIFIGGLFHETPLDWQSFAAEQQWQGTVNHLLDSMTDIAANISGMALGYILPGDSAVGTAVRWGNHILGPGEPDPAFGGAGGAYAGHPSAAWGQYP